MGEKGEAVFSSWGWGEIGTRGEGFLLGGGLLLRSKSFKLKDRVEG